MKKFLLFLLIAAVYVVHQDNWNWSNSELIFGFLPKGLAYHAGYSVLAAIMMAILVKFAWPEHLEESGSKNIDVNVEVVPDWPKQIEKPKSDDQKPKE